jgi:hypothetical protein
LIHKSQPRFLAELRRLPCLKCGQRPSEAAHIRLTSVHWFERTSIPTGAGGAQKPHDAWALPLCAHCHRIGPHAEHVIGTVAFYERWSVDPHEIAWALFTRRENRDALAAVAMAVLHLGFGKR